MVEERPIYDAGGCRTSGGWRTLTKYHFQCLKREKRLQKTAHPQIGSRRQQTDGHRDKQGQKAEQQPNGEPEKKSVQEKRRKREKKERREREEREKREKRERREREEREKREREEREKIERRDREERRREKRRREERESRERGER